MQELQPSGSNQTCNDSTNVICCLLPSRKLPVLVLNFLDQFYIVHLDSTTNPLSLFLHETQNLHPRTPVGSHHYISHFFCVFHFFWTLTQETDKKSTQILLHFSFAIFQKRFLAHLFHWLGRQKVTVKFTCKNRKNNELVANLLACRCSHKCVFSTPVN